MITFMRKTLKVLLGTSLLLGSMLFYGPARADLIDQPILQSILVALTDDSLSKGSTFAFVLNEYMTNAIATYEATQIKRDQTAVPDYGSIVAGNTSLVGPSGAASTVMQGKQSMLQQSLANLLLNSASIQDMMTYMASLAATDYTPTTTVEQNAPYPKNASVVTGDENLSVTALMDPAVYTLKSANGSLSQANYALNFINFLSNMANPVPTLDLTAAVKGLNYYDNDDTNKKNPHPLTVDMVQDMSQVQQYRLSLRVWVAAKSIAMNNLYHFYEERMPINGLGNTAGLPTDMQGSSNSASQLQVEQYLANRRIDPSWYQSMEALPPAAVQREILYTLVEMRKEAFQQRIETERLNATLSTLLLVNLQSSGKFGKPLDQLAKDASDAIAQKYGGQTSTNSNLPDLTPPGGTKGQ